MTLWWRVLHGTSPLIFLKKCRRLQKTRHYAYDVKLWKDAFSFIHPWYFFSLFHAEKLELKARESVVISVEICSGGFLRLIIVVSIHRTLSSLHNKVQHKWTTTVIAFVCVCVCLASGWMYHIADQYSGRNSWDSFPSSGPNRAPWAPGSNRHWAPPSRSSILHIHLKA